jgi:hypothetical protein
MRKEEESSGTTTTPVTKMWNETNFIRKKSTTTTANKTKQKLSICVVNYLRFKFYVTFLNCTLVLIELGLSQFYIDFFALCN